MYCRASATLAMRSSSRIRDMAAFRIPKTNWAANLPSRGRPWIASRYTTCNAAARLDRLCWFACSVSMRPAPAAAAATLPLHECRLEHPLQIASVAARCGVLQSGRETRRAIRPHDRIARRGRARAQPARARGAAVLAGGRPGAGGERPVRELRRRFRAHQSQSRHRARSTSAAPGSPSRCSAIIREDWRETAR